MRYTVAITNEDGEITTGMLDGDTLNGQHPDALIGQTVTITMRDQSNTYCANVQGKLAEVLEEA